MSFDAHQSFAYSTVLTPPSPAASGTSLTVATGEGANFPTAPFNCTVWPADAQTTIANAEIVRVTAIVGDVLTIIRTQEGTSARTIIVGDQFAETVTPKAFTDIEAAVEIVSNAVSVEASARVAAINTVSNAISVEAVARATKDDSLSAAVDVVSAAVNVAETHAATASAAATSADNHANTVSAAVDIVSNAVSAAGILKQDVSVTLGSAGFDIKVNPAAVVPGLLAFNVFNAGFGHELLVIRTEQTAADLVSLASVAGGTFDETGYDVRVDTGSMAHLVSTQANVVLEAGHYVLVCNEPGHTHLGMALDWTVKDLVSIHDRVSALSAGLVAASALASTADAHANTVSVRAVSISAEVVSLAILNDASVSAVIKADALSADRVMSTAIKADVASVSAAIMADVASHLTSTSALIKADIASVSAAIKTDAASMDTALSTVIKADVASVSAAIKTDTASMDTALSAVLKADALSADRVMSVSIKADLASVSAVIKADALSADTAMSTVIKADIASVSAAIKTDTTSAINVLSNLASNWVSAAFNASTATSSPAISNAASNAASANTALSTVIKTDINSVSAAIKTDAASMDTALSTVIKADALSADRVMSTSIKADAASMDTALSAVIWAVSARNAAGASVKGIQSALNNLSNAIVSGALAASTAGSIAALSNAISNDASVSAAIFTAAGIPQFKAVTGAQAVTSTFPQKVSGLSLSIAANGVYNIHGQILLTQSTAASASAIFQFGMSINQPPTTAAFVLIGNKHAFGAVGTLSAQVQFAGVGAVCATPSIMYSVKASVAASGTPVQTTLIFDGTLVAGGTGGLLKVLVGASTTSNTGINVIAGSYIRCFKVG